jgi:hypothetical protein
MGNFFSTGKRCTYIPFDKNVFGYTLGDFFRTHLVALVDIIVPAQRKRIVKVLFQNFFAFSKKEQNRQTNAFKSFFCLIHFYFGKVKFEPRSRASPTPSPLSVVSFTPLVEFRLQRGCRAQGCQIFSWYNIPKLGKNIPNGHKLCQIDEK